MELHTERLRLRKFTPEDFADVHSYSSNAENTKYMPFGPNTPKDTREFITRTIKQNSALPRKYYDFIIETRAGGGVVGACGLYLDQDSQAAAGWILHRNFHNKGYMTEAAKQLIDFGFSALELHRIYATCIAENRASARVMEKCGMRLEARHKKSRRIRGDNQNWYDELLYAILCEEWSLSK